MGNWCMKFLSKNNNKKIVLLLLGLDNAGKTAVTKHLKREDFGSELPTMGFSVVNLNHEKHSVLVYELGGSEQIRNIWHKYYSDVHGLIFVVDSGDSHRLSECEAILDEILCHKQMNGKPVLILANKQDCEEALDEIDLVEKLHIEDIVNKHQCPTLVQPSIAKGHPDSNSGIIKGFNWLLAYIVKNYDTINFRVLADIKKQQEDELATKKPKRSRTFIKGCFGDSWIPRNIAEFPQTPKRTFLLTTLANSTNKLKERPGSCPVRESKFNKGSDTNRRVRSAVEYVSGSQKHMENHNKNARRRSKYFLSPLSLFINRNKVGIME